MAVSQVFWILPTPTSPSGFHPVFPTVSVALKILPGITNMKEIVRNILRWSYNAVLVAALVLNSACEVRRCTAEQIDALSLAEQVASRWEKLEGYTITYRLKHARYPSTWVNHSFWFGPPTQKDTKNRKFRYVQVVENPGEPHLTAPFLVDKSVSWDGKWGTRFERKYISKTKAMSYGVRFHGTSREESRQIDPYTFLPTLLAGVNVVASPLNRAVTTQEDMDRWTYEVVEEGERLGKPATCVRWHMTELGENDKWLRQAWILNDESGLPVEFEFNDPSGEDQDHSASLKIDGIVELPNGHPVPKSGRYDWTSRGVNLDYEFEYVDCKPIDEAKMRDWSWEPPTGTRTDDLTISDISVKPFAPEEERLIREYLLSLQAPGGGFLSRWGWTAFNMLCICVITFAVYVRVRPSFAS